MPMVRCRERHYINIFVLQELSDIRVTFDLMPIAIAPIQFSVEDFAVNVAQGCQASALDSGEIFDVALASPVEANHSITNIAISAGNPHGGGCLGSNFGAAGLEKTK